MAEVPAFVDSRYRAYTATNNLILEQSLVPNLRWRFVGIYRVPNYAPQLVAGSTTTYDMTYDFSLVLNTTGTVGAFMRSKIEETHADQAVLVVGARQQGGQGECPGHYVITAFNMPTTTTAHELGHNFGLTHDRYTDTTVYGLPAYTTDSYNHGHSVSFKYLNGNNVIVDMRMGDVMSYANAKMPYFANPKIMITTAMIYAATGWDALQFPDPSPLGVDVGQGEAAYAARTLWENAQSMASYRNDPAQVFPKITAQPVGPSGAATTVHLSVTATGTNLTYQWRFNYAEIANATSATLDTAVTAAGNYDVMVTNPMGTVISNAVAVTTPPPAIPTITTGPPATVVTKLGSNVTLSVTSVDTTGSGLTYQWAKNGANIAGATGSSLTINGVLVSTMGSYTVTVTNNLGSVTSAASNVLVTGNASLADISTRAYSGPGNGVAIGGFVISGNTPKTVLLRAVGADTMTNWGIASSEVLLDPTIEVHHGNDVIATNDDWNTQTVVGYNAGNAAAITAAASRVGAAGMNVADTKSSALLLTLYPGVYSFLAQGKAGSANNASGVVLVEVYDADATPTDSKLADISARATSAAGNGVAIGGFVITGATAKTVLLRAVGSTTMTNWGIASSEVLLDPTIEVHHGNDIIATNDDWSTNPNKADILATASRVGAAGLNAADVKSSALLVTLLPGVYSFLAKGAPNSANGATGVVLVEVYDAD